jgi:hypothetical protein
MLTKKFHHSPFYLENCVPDVKKEISTCNNLKSTACRVKSVQLQVNTMPNAALKLARKLLSCFALTGRETATSCPAGYPTACCMLVLIIVLFLPGVFNL